MARTPSPSFLAVFGAVVLVTVLSGLAAFILSFEPTPTSQQVAMFDLMGTTWRLGLGAIFGLIGRMGV